MSFVHPRLARSVSIAGLACISLASVACTTLQARLPDGFAAQATEYAVTGHSPRRFNEPVRIGPYSALEMREGSTFSWSLPLGIGDLRRTSKPYAFTMIARDQPPVEVQCRTRAAWAGAGPESRRVEIDLTALDGPLMGCGLSMDGMPARELRLARTGTTISGALESPWGTRYAVTSLSHYEGSRWPSGVPTAYRIASGDDTLAVVDVVNAGRVHLANGLDAEQRVYLAAAAASLLLLDPELGE